jgi:Mrp family chromosome partitioning ATPase
LSNPPSTTTPPEQGAHAPYLRAIRAHPVLVAAVAIVAVAAAVAWQKARTPAYEATAQVLVTPVSGGGPYVGLPVITESSNYPSRTLQTATSVLKSPAAALATAIHMPGHWARKSVTERINVQPLGESNIVSITGTASSAALAATLANTYTHEALSLHAKQLVAEATAEISQLQARQRSIGAGEASQIAGQLTALSSVAAGRDPNFSLLQNATPPTSATASSTKLIAVLALLAGLIIGAGAATGIEYLNRRVRDEDEVLSLYPLPVLSRIPVLPRGARDATSFQTIPPRVREAFRTLQVQLPLESSTTGRAVMFTSASPRDGKTASAIDFALVLAAADLRVILLDFDLRKPEIGERLGVHADYSDLVRADASLHDLLLDVPSTPGLRIVSSRPQGTVAPLLAMTSRRLPELLHEARDAADYVIVDTPPVGQVSDALRVATAVDEVIVVARTANTNREELTRTRELLDRMGIVPAGLLVIGDTGNGSNIYAEYGGDIAVAPVDRPVRSAATSQVASTATSQVAERGGAKQGRAKQGRAERGGAEQVGSGSPDLGVPARPRRRSQ